MPGAQDEEAAELAAYKAEVREIVDTAYMQLPPGLFRQDGPRLGYLFDEPEPIKKRKAQTVAGPNKKRCLRISMPEEARPRAPQARVRIPTTHNCF